MKASLLARVTPALLLTTILAGGVGTAAYAQTAAPSATATGSASGATSSDTTASGTAATTPATTPTTHHATTRHTRAARRASGQTMAEMAERRITDLHKQLQITAQEQPQWDQFAQVMRDNAKDLDQAYQQRGANFDKMNAVENMQSYAQIEQTRAQDMQKLVPAFQALYTSLSDQQKQEADTLFRNEAAKAQVRHTKPAH